MLGRLAVRLHQWLGLTAGGVIAFMGLTGASISFKDEIIHALNPGVVVRLDGAGPAQSAPQLLACAQSRERLTSLTIHADPSRAARAQFGDDVRYFDPSTCAPFGAARGERALKLLEDLHRKLAMGNTGKAITGACAIVLVVMVIAGLIRPWPRVRRPWYRLHSVIGPWLIVFLLHSALTGLFFAYDWYRDGVYRIAGLTPPPARGARGKAEPAAAPDLGVAWSVFQRDVPAFRSATLRLPDQPDAALQIQYLEPDAPHEKASSRIEIDPASGEVKKHERYSSKSRGGKLVASMFPLHSGSFYGLGGRIAVLGASLSLPFFFVSGWTLYLARRRRAGDARTAVAEAVT